MHGAAARTCDDQGGTPFHEASLTCYPFDVAQANTLLDQASWTGPRTPEGYRTRNGQTLELRYNATTRVVRQQTERIAQEAWQRVGLKVEDSPTQCRDYCDHVPPRPTSNLYTGDFDIAEVAHFLGYDPDDHRVFMCDQAPSSWRSHESNYMRYCNQTVDALERLQQTTADVTARQAAFHLIHAQILQDVPVMYLYSPANIYCYDTRLQHYAPSALGATETWNIWEWEWAQR